MATNEKNLPATDRAGLLAQCESRIAEGFTKTMEGVTEARLALWAIHEQDLWREAGFGSFSAYLAERWPLSRGQAYRALGWVREVAAEIGDDFLALPASAAAETVARATVGLPSVRQATASRAAKRPPQGPDEAVDVGATRTVPTMPAPTTPATPVPRGAPVPVQLSLFDVPTKDLLGELRNRLATTDTAARGALVAQLRALLAVEGTPRNPHPAPSSERCSCTPAEFRPSKAASNVCANCRKVRVR